MPNPSSSIRVRSSAAPLPKEAISVVRTLLKMLACQDIVTLEDFQFVLDVPGQSIACSVEAYKPDFPSITLPPSLRLARAVLFCIQGGADITLSDIDKVADAMRKAAPQANHVFSSLIQEGWMERIRVSAVATGIPIQTIDKWEAGQPAPSD